MTIFLTVLATFLFIMAIMAVGVICGRKPIAGSCGGVGRALQEDNYECPICGDDPERCDKSGSDRAAATNTKGWYKAQ
mgnify:CR=1 FL=1